jgi:hypothetical protein
MGDRKDISKKTRFEIFKRDSFTCQYCGRKAPDVLLVIDHIEPVSKGGTNDILNLITSCQECNAGKSDRRLADTAVVDRQRQQLELLQERKEQIEMMFQWQKGLLDLDNQVTTQLASYWSEVAPGYTLSDHGTRTLRQLQRKFNVGEIMVAMQVAADQYLLYEGGMPTLESVETAWQKIGGICTVRRKEKENPNIQRVYYVRGILKKRLSYVNESLALALISDAVELGASLDSLETHAKNVRNWTQWRREIETFIEQQKSRNDVVDQRAVASDLEQPDAPEG